MLAGVSGCRWECSRKLSVGLALSCQGPSSDSRWGYPNCRGWVSHHGLGPQACDLRKRVTRTGWWRGPCGIREEVWVRATVLAGLVRTLTRECAGDGGMQSWWTCTPWRLGSGVVGRVRTGAFRLIRPIPWLGGHVRCALEAGMNCRMTCLSANHDRTRATGVNARMELVTCGVLVSGSSTGLPQTWST